MLKEVQVGDILRNPYSGTVVRVTKIRGEYVSTEVLSRTTAGGPMVGTGTSIKLPSVYWEVVQQAPRPWPKEHSTPSPKYIEHLRARVRKQESELSHLKATLAAAEKELFQWVGENLV